MYAKLAICLSFFLLTSCVSGPSEEQKFVDSIRTDGTYVSIKHSKTGNKGYLRFYPLSDGSKILKLLEMQQFTLQEFNENAKQVSNFSVNPAHQEIKYNFNDGIVDGVRSINLRNFVFVKDGQ